MSLIPQLPRRVLILTGLTLALLLGVLGSCTIRYHSNPTPISHQRLAELDAKAKPFFDDAHRHVPEAVRRLTGGKAFWKLCWYAVKDKVGSGTFSVWRKEQGETRFLMQVGILRSRYGGRTFRLLPLAELGCLSP